MRVYQDTSLNILLEAAILEKVECAAEALASGRENMDAKRAVSFLRISESEFKRMASRLPLHAVTERRYIYLRTPGVAPGTIMTPREAAPEAPDPFRA